MLRLHLKTEFFVHDLSQLKGTMRIFNSENAEKKLRFTAYLLLAAAMLAAAAGAWLHSSEQLSDPHFRLVSLLAGLCLLSGGIFMGAAEEDSRIRFIGWILAFIGLLMCALYTIYI